MAKIKSIKRVPEIWVWVSHDFSGEELRIAANLSGERAWIDTFLNGGDLHKQTAIRMVGEENYNKGVRKVAKIFNFQMLYLASPQGFVGTPYEGKPMDLDTATDFHAKYQAALPTLMSWQKQICDKAVKVGVIRTLFGRPRHVEVYDKKEYNTKRRYAANFVIQGLGADILKLALMKLYKAGYFTSEHIRFMNTVHDEINFAVKFYSEEHLSEVMKEIQDLMYFTYSGWEVPIIVSGSIGNSFGMQLEVTNEGGRIVPKVE